MKKIKVNKQKKIALVAHDNQKEVLFDWLDDNIDAFKEHQLIGTGTTSTLIRNRYQIEITSLLSGPLGGDQQLGALIAQGEIDILFFFWDPLTAQPHDPDVKALLRISALYDVVIAQSVSGANFIIHSPYWNQEYVKEISTHHYDLNERVQAYSQNNPS